MKRKLLIGFIIFFSIKQISCLQIKKYGTQLFIAVSHVWNVYSSSLLLLLSLSGPQKMLRIQAESESIANIPKPMFESDTARAIQKPALSPNTPVIKRCTTKDRFINQNLLIFIRRFAPPKVYLFKGATKCY